MAYLHRGMGPTVEERDLMNNRRRKAQTCSHCGSKRSEVEMEEDRTWQQWHCGSCGSWEDRTDIL